MKKSKKKNPKKAAKVKKSIQPKFVKITRKGYWSKLRGIKVYYEGKKPNMLQKDGTFTLGKNILDVLHAALPKYHLILTENTDEIKIERGIHRVRLSPKSITKINGEGIVINQKAKEALITKFFYGIYPTGFKVTKTSKYKSGNLEQILGENIIDDLSAGDKSALNKFIPEFLAKESPATIKVVKAAAEIKTLKQIAANLKDEMTKGHNENWWQDYVHKHILIIQQGYIHAIEKLNTALGTTKLPDFALITHDGFLDILEIKKPDTDLLKEDTSRKNFYWESEISKAIIQVENYIENVSANQGGIRSYIKDTLGIEQKVLRPRGIILAGDTQKHVTQKHKDDFRLLSLSTKNITFVTYDELATRLDNYIEVLKKYSKSKN